MRKIKLQKIVGNLMDKLRKLHERNGHLEILSFPQGIENSRQFLLLCPYMVPKVSISARELIVITNWSKSNAELVIQSILYTRHFFYIKCITKKKIMNRKKPLREVCPEGRKDKI